MDKYYQYICDKIDFNKKFFAPIIEEDDIGRRRNNNLSNAKENIKSKDTQGFRWKITFIVKVILTVTKIT